MCLPLPAPAPRVARASSPHRPALRRRDHKGNANGMSIGTGTGTQLEGADTRCASPPTSKANTSSSVSQAKANTQRAEMEFANVLAGVPSGNWIPPDRNHHAQANTGQNPRLRCGRHKSLLSGGGALKRRWKHHLEATIAYWSCTLCRSRQQAWVVRCILRTVLVDCIARVWSYRPADGAVEASRPSRAE